MSPSFVINPCGASGGGSSIVLGVEWSSLVAKITLSLPKTLQNENAILFLLNVVCLWLFTILVLSVFLKVQRCFRCLKHLKVTRNLLIMSNQGDCCTRPFVKLLGYTENNTSMMYTEFNYFQIGSATNFTKESLQRVLNAAPEKDWCEYNGIKITKFPSIAQ